jgi:hypothetical protein
MATGQEARPTRREFLRAVGAAGAVASVVGATGLRLPGGGERGMLHAPPPVEGPGLPTTAFMDPLWDPDLGLIRTPFDQGGPIVRETAWYANGLLTRNGPGDLQRATVALETVASFQYDAPGQPYHGSFRRAPDEPPFPPDPAREFLEFDPNWRQFIGTALALAVERHGDELGTLRATLEHAIDLAVEGERAARVQADYSNIAIMQAWLLAYTGSKREGEALARTIMRRYRRAGALDEYNSPTYDGVALYGLRLWRDEPPTRVFADLGDELYDDLWRDIGALYHPGLRNLAGPYSRAYGMSLGSYASLVGLWIWEVVGTEQAPFPSLAEPFAHAADACFGPMVGLFDGAVPAAVQDRLLAFSGPHRVRAGTGGPKGWTATSWLAEWGMAGGWSGPPVGIGGQQIVPGTVHWAHGWIRVRNPLGGVDATAMPDCLDVEVNAPGPATVTVGIPGLDPSTMAGNPWILPGLKVQVNDSSPLGPPRATLEGVEVGFGPGSFRLDVEPI